MAYTTIDKPTDYFNTKIFTGNNSANNSITGIGFQPDWIWFKNRNAANDHALVDSVRGRKALRSNLASAELTLNADKDFQSFDSDGFTVDVVEQLNSFNKSGDSIVTWNWLASNTTASNTDGTITSTVSANQTAGFSIVSYTGTGSDANVGHSLSSAPQLIITKSRSATGDWKVHTSAIDGSWDVGTLNSTAAFGNSSYTAPTNSIFYVGTGAPTNASGVTYVSYLFHSVKGYSKCGVYSGNGSTNGTFVYTGFKPAFVMIKKTNSTQNWGIYDNKREPFNTNDAVLFPNVTTTETSSVSYALDFVSNGFKQRATGNQSNGSGQTYIYMAFAENPFVTSSGVPACAR